MPIKIEDVVKEVEAAVGDIRGGGDPFLGGKPDFVLLKDPGIIGFRVPLDSLEGERLKDASGIADRLGGKFGGRGGLILDDRDIIVGFMAPERLQF